MKPIVITFFLLVFISNSFAQGGPPTPPDPANSGAPIDGDVFFLLIAGIFWGSVAYLKNRQQTSAN